MLCLLSLAWAGDQHVKHRHHCFETSISWLRHVLIVTTWHDTGCTYCAHAFELSRADSDESSPVKTATDNELDVKQLTMTVSVPIPRGSLYNLSKTEILFSLLLVD